MSSASSTRDQIGMHGCFSELGVGIVEYREVSALFFVIGGDAVTYFVMTFCYAYFIHCLHLTSELTAGRRAFPGVERTVNSHQPTGEHSSPLFN